MSRQSQPERPEKLAHDFEQADLGDARLDRRIGIIASALSERPDESYPQTFEDPRDLDAFYDFVEHDWLTYESILEPHYEATRRRAQVAGTVCVIHDTTEYSFVLRDENLRTHLARMSAQRQGFLGHLSMATIPGHPGCPIGMAHVQPFVHQSQLVDEPSRQFWQRIGGVMDSERERWIRGVERAEQRLEGVDKVIHLLDAEGDAFEILAPLVTGGHDFVCRLGQDRRVEHDAPEIHLIDELMDAQPIVGTRRIWLSERKPQKPSYKTKKHKPRSARFAELSMRSARVTIRRPDKLKARQHLPESIELNVVELLEDHPPNGEQPVRWLLATSEPIDEVSDIEKVAELYEQRWLIEEFNKSTKTGCSFGKRQLESAETLLNALALTLPVALDLLVLRHLSREAPETPSEAVVTKRQLAILMAVVAEQQWSEQPTVAEATRAIARLGGHIAHNGPPGWIVLGRGYQQLLTLEKGWRAAEQASQARDDPS